MDVKAVTVEIAKLKLAPGDVLVIKERHRLSMAECEQLQLIVKSVVPAEIPVIVLDNTVDLEVLSHGGD